MLCFWCDGHFSKLTRDHIKPSAVGGKTTVDNLVMACGNCNHERGDLVTFHCHLVKIKKGELKVNQKIIDRTNKRQQVILPIREKWVRIETEKCGWSPSSELFFYVPVLSSIAAFVKYPVSSKDQPLSYREELKLARRLAEARFDTKQRQKFGITA